MRDLPIALTFDLDSDLFDESVAPTDGHTRISWRGITEGIPLIRERLAQNARDVIRQTARRKSEHEPHRTRFTHCAAMPASLTTPVHFSISLLI